MIVSSIEGRIRFLDKNIKKPEVADKINNVLKGLEGIEDIRINDVIGSLLINYDENNITFAEIINILKKHIDTSLKLHNTLSQKNNLIDGAVEMFKREMGSKRNKRCSNNNNLTNVVVENLTVNKVIKGVLYSVLGVQGYKKGKGLMRGQGKGKKG